MSQDYNRLPHRHVIIWVPVNTCRTLDSPSAIKPFETLGAQGSVRKVRGPSSEAFATVADEFSRHIC
jgi:hypothetical protein